MTKDQTPSREEVIRWAREAGLPSDELYHPNLERFVALAYDAGAAAEREACCSGEVLNAANINGGDHPHQVIEKYQAAIRARKENT